MGFTKEKLGAQSVGDKTLSDDVYVRFVTSLFANAHILIAGAVVYFIIAMVVYFQTQQPLFLLFAGILPAANLWRYLGIRAFHKEGEGSRTVESAKRWERDYILRGSGQGLAVGAFCFVAIYIHPSAYAEIASLSMAIGSLITVATRNYGSQRMVRILSASFIGLAAIACLLRGDLAYAVLGLMILPLTAITVSSAGYVRTVLFSAIVGQKRADLLAQQFDRALNTMPQGLLMLDRRANVIVANAEAAHLFGLPAAESMNGRSLATLMRRAVAVGLMARDKCEFATQQLIRALHDGFDRKLIVALLDGRSFEVTTREGDNDLGVVIFEDVTLRERASQRISTMARFDSLTELPNRVHTHELIVERLASGPRDRTCALAIFDLDDLKGINDSLGHRFGDDLIQTIGKRLTQYVSDDVIVGRLGGDEFIVYHDDVQDIATLMNMLDAMRVTIGSASDISSARIRLQASGGAVTMPAETADVDKMIVRADLALHTAKARGKNSLAMFENAMEQSFRMRETLKSDLRAAIGEGSLRVVYQPIVRLDTMKIATCEALCRWDHPELGQISPAIFIPLAEETGIIAEITSFVLNQACNDSLRWPEHIGVSVNLSGKDFADSGIVQKVALALNSSGLAPERLEIEMTETSLLDDKSEARIHAESIRQLGVHIALDDFGTGYSSLSYLHRLPLDKIKIDRSFLMDMNDNKRSRQLIKSIVQLSHRLGMTVTVEGVETFDQLKLLASEVHPDLVQGFLFGSALTASGIETMSTTAWQFASDAASFVNRAPRRRQAASGNQAVAAK